MACKKCRAKASRPTPEYLAVLEPDSDMRTAEVYFHQFVSVVIDGSIKDFYPAEIIRLNFSLIHLLLLSHPDCLSLRKVQERVLYDAAF